MRNFLFILAICMSIKITAQFSKKYSNSSAIMSANGLIKDALGNYLIAGGNALTDNIQLVYTDPSGNIIWQNELDNQGQQDEAMELTQLTDGNFALVARTFTTNPQTGQNLDILVAKINSANGNPIWAKVFGTPQNDWPESICSTSDGGLVVTGSWVQSNFNFDIFAIKFSSTGYHMWNKVIDYGSNDYSYDIKQTTDGGYIIAGSSVILTNLDVCLTKLSSNGTFLWAKGYGVTASDIGRSVEELANGDLIVGGHAKVNTNTNGSYFVKTNASGNLIWSSFYSAPTSLNSEVHNIAISGSDFISTGSQLIKINSLGNQVWSKQIPGESNNLVLNTNSSICYTGQNSYLYLGLTDNTGYNCATSNLTLSPIVHITCTNSVQNSNITITMPIIPLQINLTTSNSNLTASNLCLCPADAGPDRANLFRPCCNPQCSEVILGQPSAGYTYAWLPTTGLSCANCSQPNASPCASTIYTLTVSGTNCLTNNDIVTVNTTTGPACDCGQHRNAIADDTGITTFDTANTVAAPVQTNNSEVKNTGRLLIKPNPNKGEFTINIQKDKEYSIEILNSLGQIVYKQNQTGIESNIDISTQPPGVYFCKIYSLQGSATMKIIKQ